VGEEIANIDPLQFTRVLTLEARLPNGR